MPVLHASQPEIPSAGASLCREQPRGGTVPLRIPSAVCTPFGGAGQQCSACGSCADSTAGLRPFGKLSQIPGAPVWVFFTWERRFHTSGTSASSQQGATANTPKLSSRQPSSLLAPFPQGPLSTKFPPPHGAGPSCSTAHGPWNQPCPTAPKPGEPTGRAASLRPREAVRVRRRPRAEGRSTAEGACRQRCPTRVRWANWAALILGRILGC